MKIQNLWIFYFWVMFLLLIIPTLSVIAFLERKPENFMPIYILASLSVSYFQIGMIFIFDWMKNKKNTVFL